MAKYPILTFNEYLGENGISIKTISSEYAEEIRVWRNAQKDVLRQNKKISYVDQKAYYKKVILPSIQANNPSQILFNIFLSEKLIGMEDLYT